MFTSGSGTGEGGLQDQASHFMDKREGAAGAKSRQWLRSCFVSGSGLPRGSPQGITLSLLPGSNFQLEGDPIYLAEFPPHWKLSVKWLVFKSTLYYFEANFDKIFQTSLHDSVKLGRLEELIMREHLVLQNKTEKNNNNRELKEKSHFAAAGMVLCNLQILPHSGRSWSWCLHSDKVSKTNLESPAGVLTPFPQLASCVPWSKLLYFLRPWPHV